MSAEKAMVSGLAGRYAVALFDLAYEDKTLDAVADDFATLAGLIKEDENLSRFIRSPLQTRDDLAKAMEIIAAKAGLSQLMAKFLGVLAANGRLRHLDDVAASYRALLAHHRGEVAAEVTSAHQLNDEQLAALKQRLKQSLGRDVAVETHLDESLLGGLVVKVGSRMIDSSLRTKLKNLKFAMKGLE